MIDFPSQDPQSEKEEHPIHATPLSQQENRTLFQKFKAVAVHLFTTQNSKSEHHLTGRIHTLQNTANQVLSELNQIKAELALGVDPDLLNSIDAVVKPIVRDIERIQRKVNHSRSIDEKEDAAKHYSQWIERARPWVHFLSTNLTDRKAIIHAVVRHTIQISEELVRRDLQVIQDYQNHKLAEMGKDDGERMLLKERIDQALSKQVEDLTRLQRSEPPKVDEIGLKELETWKERIENLREKLYNKALQIIDETFTVKETKEQHDHVLSNLNRIAKIEEEVEQLQKALRKHVLDEEEIHATLDQIQNEIRNILLSIALTPELADRVRRVKNEIDAIRENFLKFG